jgi:hypothetical protein
MNNWLNGKKTLIAGISAALTGLGTAIGTLQDGFQMADLQVWGIALSAVMAIFGFGGKLQKLIDAINGSK